MRSFAVLSIALICTSCVVGEYFEKCSLVEEGTFVSVENECQSYIYCGGADDSYKDECPDGTYFDEDQSECLFDTDNICPRKQKENADDNKVDIQEEEDFSSSSITTTTTTSSSSSSSTNTIQTSSSTVYSPTPRPVCDRNFDAYYPHQDRCEYYYKCVAGYLTILRCNLHYVWDYRQEACVSEENAAEVCYGSAVLKKF